MAKRHLRTSDLKNLCFEYEFSHYRLSFILDCFYTEDVVALIYLLMKLKRNISVGNVNPTLKFTSQNDYILTCGDVISIYAAEYEPRKISKIDTQGTKIIDIYNQIRINQPLSLDEEEYNIIKSLGTLHWKKILSQIKYLMPEMYQDSRTSSTNLPVLYERYNWYQLYLERKVYDLETRLERPHILKPIFSTATLPPFPCQPRYSGIRCCVCFSSPNIIRIFNKFGKLISTKYCPLNYNAVLECVIINKDQGKYKTWRFNGKRVYMIVDIYKLNFKFLTNTPFKERQDILKTLYLPSNFIVSQIESSDALQQKYNSEIDLFSYMNGVVYKPENSLLYDDQSIFSEYKFVHSWVYDFFSNSLVPMEKFKSVATNKFQIDPLSIHFTLEMAEHKTYVLVYGEDEMYFYICRFNIKTFQYQHAVRLTKSLVPITLLYRENAYVQGNKTKILGIALLKIYFNSNKEIVGYESKPGSSHFQVNHFSCLLCESCSYEQSCSDLCV
jgi:hypothetical protein